MSYKQELILQIDNLILQYGKDNPALLRDLQMHRDAVANALNKKDLVNITCRLANVAKLLIDFWPGS